MVERSNQGTAREIERPLPKRLQPEGSANSTTAGEVSWDAAWTAVPVRSTGSNPIQPASPGSSPAASNVATPPAKVPINTSRDLSTDGNPSAPLSSFFASSATAAPLRQ